MKIVHHIEELRQTLAPFQRPAFVPTMGNLHAGHIALVEQARPLGDVTVASIFVNRLQFLPHEDFDSYPRTWDADCAQLKAAGCHVLFAPREADLYPVPQTFKVQPDPALADMLEGHFRPGFFTGVCTVVMKLFACVFGSTGGGFAVFGKKDYQQLLVVRRMVQQFALPIEIVGVETARAEDGLALSSRNGYLSMEERKRAGELSGVLQQLALSTRAGHRQLIDLEAEATKLLHDKGWATDYLTVRERDSLRVPPPTGPVPAVPLVALGAARLGNTRLIDNLEF